jgi:arylsulfatase A
MDRRSFLKTVAAGSLLAGLRGARGQGQSRPPNIVFILADDLGYGDLGCYGSSLRTPKIDGMAQDGVRFRQFYSASSVCSPARAALLTGRYPTRVGVTRVLFPDDDIGIPATETTLPQMLKGAGYRSACIGKWHVGSKGEFLPTNRGFDEFFGLPYSHDMWPRPIMRNTDIVQSTCDLDMLTQQFTKEALDFIGRQGDSPFFLYLAHTAPHIPLGASRNFHNKSPLGAYGDAVEEMDWSVGEVLRTLKESGFDDNTLVMFSSDNGPWYQGSGGVLRGRKGESYEGGMREPLIARFPGRIPANRTCPGVATMMDILPTVGRLAGAPLPGLPVDGFDIWPMMTGGQDNIDRGLFLYFDAVQLQCARLGKWKLHLSRYNCAPWEQGPAGGRWNLPLPRPELYDLEADPGESYDVAEEYPQVVADIRARIDLTMLTFPDSVRSAFRDTMRIAVDDTPAGAPPSKINP